MADQPSALGTRLREARQAAQLSRAGLADASGTSEPAIARTELYGSRPRLATLQAWAKALNIPVGHLTDDPEDRLALALERGACPNCTTPTRQVWHNGEACPETVEAAS